MEKRINPKNPVKCIGVNIDENLNWKQQISYRAVKLKKANSILSELGHFIDRKTTETMYHVIFESHLYIIPHLFGHKIQIQLKDYFFCKRKPYGLSMS